MSSNPIFLNRNATYDIGGKVVSLDEIQQAFIDQKYYKETLNSIIRGDKQ